MPFQYNPHFLIHQPGPDFHAGACFLGVGIVLQMRELRRGDVKVSMGPYAYSKQDPGWTAPEMQR